MEEITHLSSPKKDDKSQLSRKSLDELKTLYPSLSKEQDEAQDINEAEIVANDEDEINPSMSREDKIPSFSKTDNRLKRRNQTGQKEDNKMSYKPAIINQNKSVNNLLIWVALILFMLLILGLVWFLGASGNLATKSDSIDVNAVVSKLMSSFKNIPHTTQEVISSSLKNLNKSIIKQPSIILFFIDPSARNEGDQLAKQLLAYTSSKEALLIEGYSFKKQSSDDVKREIDYKLRENLDENELNTVLVTRLDKISGHAALVFHSYCDDQNAPFKRVVYLLTVESNVTLPVNLSEKDADIMVQDHLRNAWSDLRIDQLKPLLARLTVSVVPVLAISS